MQVLEAIKLPFSSCYGRVSRTRTASGPVDAVPVPETVYPAATPPHSQPHSRLPVTTYQDVPQDD